MGLFNRNKKNLKNNKGSWYTITDFQNNSNLTSSHNLSSPKRSDISHITKEQKKIDYEPAYKYAENVITSIPIKDNSTTNQDVFANKAEEDETISDRRLKSHLISLPPETRDYFLDSMPKHLASQNDAEKFCRLLSDYDFLYSKISAFGTRPLINDYDLVSSINLELGKDKINDLQLIQSAIRLSENALTKNTEHLASQLWGRLPNENTTSIIRKLLQDSKIRCKKPWIRPLTPNGYQAGSSLIHILNGHKGAITSLTVTPDGKKIISGSEDKTIRIWELETGKEIRKLLGHTEPINATTVTTDGKKIISVSDITLKIWELETGKEIQNFSVINTQGYEQEISIISLAVSHDNKKIISVSEDKTIRIWELETGKEIRKLLGHTEPINATTVTTDGKKIVFVSNNNSISIWDVDSEIHLQTLPSMNRHINAVTVTPDNTKVITGGDTAIINAWDLGLNKEEQILKGHKGAITSLTVTPDGKKIISGSENDIKIWDLESKIKINKLKINPSRAYSFAVTPNGTKIVLGGLDETVEVRDIETRDIIHRMKGHTSRINEIVITPDSKKAITVSNDTTIRVWDLDTGKEIDIMKGHTGSVTTISITPDGKKIISGSEDKTIRIWELDNEATVQVSKLTQGHIWKKKIKTFFSGKLIQTINGHNSVIRAVSITPDGKKIISGSENDIKIWDLDTGKEMNTLPGHHPINSIAVTSDNKKMFIGTNSNTIEGWYLDTGTQIQLLKGHTSSVTSTILSADDQKIISCSMDGTINVWSTTDGTVLTSFVGDEHLIKCDMTMGKKIISTIGDGGIVNFLKLQE